MHMQLHRKSVGVFSVTLAVKANIKVSDQEQGLVECTAYALVFVNKEWPVSGRKFTNILTV